MSGHNIVALDLEGWSDESRAELLYDEFGVITALFRPGFSIRGLNLPGTKTRATQLPSAKYMREAKERD